MSYDVDLGSTFRAKLAELPPASAEHVLDEVERLAERPVQLSTRSAFDNERWQSYLFVGLLAGAEYMFKINFQFSQDE